MRNTTSMKVLNYTSLLVYLMITIYSLETWAESLEDDEVLDEDWVDFTDMLYFDPNSNTMRPKKKPKPAVERPAPPEAEYQIQHTALLTDRQILLLELLVVGIITTLFVGCANYLFLSKPANIQPTGQTQAEEIVKKGTKHMRKSSHEINPIPETIESEETSHITHNISTSNVQISDNADGVHQTSDIYAPSQTREFSQSLFISEPTSALRGAPSEVAAHHISAVSVVTRDDYLPSEKASREKIASAMGSYLEEPNRHLPDYAYISTIPPPSPPPSYSEACPTFGGSKQDSDRTTVKQRNNDCTTNDARDSSVEEEAKDSNIEIDRRETDQDTPESLQKETDKLAKEEAASNDDGEASTSFIHIESGDVDEYDTDSSIEVLEEDAD